MAGLDFGKLTKRSVADTATEPMRIFAALPVRTAKYARPWDVQTRVWDRWHDRRSQSDLLVKMNTGGGKTVAGLMISRVASTNGSVGPAVYVTPDICLGILRRVECLQHLHGNTAGYQLLPQCHYARLVRIEVIDHSPSGHLASSPTPPCTHPGQCTLSRHRAP